ncbi:hypothetical protein [Actinomadura sp. BRA 177]|uniref:hypothetical protein n=1 Tax=Actinomadura sp. BRA 177 TaxID=2745202 RepID=UPI0015959A67|nr:hypothetical protein [Actinomadura sp. BRA 177]NVI85809.1 hypothetical protein [Actinomadura sp. BRA 177]
MGAALRVKVARGQFVMWWWRVRYGHATAEQHLDALADAMSNRGWSHVKVYVESPPVLWVFPEDGEDAALSVAVLQVGGMWVFQVSRLIEYPCEAVVRVAGVLDDVLQDRAGRRQTASSR